MPNYTSRECGIVNIKLTQVQVGVASGMDPDNLAGCDHWPLGFGKLGLMG